MPWPQKCNSCGHLRPYGEECPTCDMPRGDTRTGVAGALVGGGSYEERLIDEAAVRRAEK